MGKKSIWKEREKIFVLTHFWYIINYHYFLHIKQDLPLNVLYELVGYGS